MRAHSSDDSAIFLSDFSSVLSFFFRKAFRSWLFRRFWGAGRFSNIGIPHPAVMGPFVGTVEIICGALIIRGLLTMLAAIPLIVTMIVAQHLLDGSPWADPAQALRMQCMSPLRTCK